MKRLLLAAALILAGLVSAQAQYIAPYAGAVSRTNNSKMSDIISVLDFAGVDKTGAADSAAALTTMNAQIPTGACIVFPPGGTYKLNSNVSMPGRCVYLGGATFTGTGSITGIVTFGTNTTNPNFPIITFRSAAANKVFGFEITGSTYNGILDPTLGWGYNPNNTDPTEPRLGFDLEGHYFDGSTHQMEYNLEYTSAPTTFTGTGSGTNLTVTGVTGYITVGYGSTVTGPGVPSGTAIVSQTSGTPHGAGVYVTSAATTSSGAALSSTFTYRPIQLQVDRVLNTGTVSLAANGFTFLNPNYSAAGSFGMYFNPSTQRIFTIGYAGANDDLQYIGGSSNKATSEGWLFGPNAADSTTLTISSGTYDNVTGLVTLTMLAPVSFSANASIYVNGFTGTGAFASLMGNHQAISVSSATVTYNPGAGLGASTITGGSLVNLVGLQIFPGGSVYSSGQLTARSTLQFNNNLISKDGNFNWTLGSPDGLVVNATSNFIGQFNILGGIASTSPDTGNLVINGGLGVSGQVSSSSQLVNSSGADVHTHYINSGVDGYVGANIFGLAGMIAGSASAHPFIVVTNGAERARISSAGGFSIGTTTDPGANNLLLNGTATITPAVNTNAVAISGGSITGSSTVSPGINVVGTLNTSGVVQGAGIFANITNTASGAGTSLFDLQTGGVSRLTLIENGVGGAGAQGSYLEVPIGSANAAYGPGLAFIGDSTTGFSDQGGNLAFWLSGAIETNITANAYRLRRDSAFGWSSATNNNAGVDTGFSRDSAGVVDLGNGTQGNKSGTLQMTNITASGAAVIFSGISTDAAATDTTACIRSSDGTLLKGSGTLGICLGTSGRQFKTAFAPMAAGIDELMRINLQNYRYIKGYGDSGARMQYGAVAQDVEAVLPDLAGHDAKGKTINYDSGALLFIGLHAIQQLKADNDNLHNELRALKTGTK